MVPPGATMFPTELESRRNADRLDGGIDSPALGDFQDRVLRFAIGTVDHRRRAEPLGDLKAIVVEIDHDDLATARKTAR